MTPRGCRSLYAPAPKFITPRDFSCATEGGQIAKLSRALRRPLMPHQRLVVDGATELTGAGFYRYPLVLVTLPRQSGKTTMLTPVQLHRIMTRSNIKAFFTAQTGKDAGDRMRDMISIVTASPLAPLFKARYAAGSMGLSLANGSKLTTFAPGPAALHGETPHLVTLDEIWKHDQTRGRELMGAIGPAQSTLEGESQIWMVSTMGTAQSGFMNELVERGRAGWPGMFYAEWSLGEGLDAYDPQSWWSFHPALGNTITESYLRKEAADQPLGEWMRAYMNVLTQSSNPLIAAEDWAQLGAVEPLAVPARNTLTIAYEVAPNGETGAIVAGWRDLDGAPCIRLLHAAPGTAWMIPLIRWISAEWKPAQLAADDGGETRRITDELTREGIAVSVTGPRDFATACINLLTWARDDKTLKVDRTETFARAVAVVVLRPMGESWRFSRKDSPGPIAALIAGAVALWVNDHADDFGKPEIFS